MGTGTWSVGDEITAGRLNECFQSDFWGANIGSDVCFLVGNRGAFVWGINNVSKITGGEAKGRTRVAVMKSATSSPNLQETLYDNIQNIYNTDSVAGTVFRNSCFFYVPYASNYPYCWLYSQLDEFSNLSSDYTRFKYINL